VLRHKIRISLIAVPILAWAQVQESQDAENLMREAAALEAQGRLGEAAALLNKALGFARTAEFRDPKYADLLAVTLSNFGSIREKQGEIREAVQHYKESLRTWQKRYQQTGYALDELGISKSMNNLGWLYNQIGETKQAEGLLLSSLEIKRRRLPRGNPEIVHSLLNLGSVYVGKKRFEEARLILEEAEALAKNVPDGGLLFSRSLAHKGLLLFEAKRRTEAIAATEEAVAILERAAGPEHPELVQVVTNLATMHASAGNHAEGLPQALRAVRIAEAKLGENHPHLAGALEAQAICLRALNRKGEAKKLLERSRRILKAHRDANLLGHQVDWNALK
jgi:hypothetical protein